MTGKQPVEIKVSGLYLEKELVGLRLNINGEMADLDLEAVKEVGIKPSTIKVSRKIELRDFGGTLMSREEHDSGTLVKDYSFDKEFLKDLKYLIMNSYGKK